MAGQSGLRLEVADRELRAQGHRVEAARREIAARAWSAYFAALAVRERHRLATRLEEATAAVATTVRAMASNGLVSEVDADIADSAALRAAHDRLALEGALAEAQARLSVLTGGPAHASVEGGLDPLRIPMPAGANHELPELLALGEQQQAAQRRVALLQRERIPNPTLSLFTQNDGFDERVLGVGLTLPVPLPQPVGRTRAGEIAEAHALADRAEAGAQRLDRELKAELAAATARLEAASKARGLYTQERGQRAVSRLEAIAAQVRAARLSVRDALIGQQALVDQLKAEIDAREDLCLASLRVARATGTSLEGNSL